jgi:hypothetical protein
MRANSGSRSLEELHLEEPAQLAKISRELAVGGSEEAKESFLRCST